MEITLTEIGPSHKSIKFFKSIDNVQKDYNAKISEVNRNVAMPGFRPGKTPRRIVEKRFSSSILDELKRDYLLEGFEKLTKEEKIRPIEEPNVDPAQISLEKDKEFVFEMEMETHPEISLTEENYKALKAEKEEVSVSDDEINDIIDRMREQKAEWAPLEKGKAEEKDMAICNVSMHSGKEQLYTEDNVSVYVENPYILGIELKQEDLLGKKAKDTLEKEVTIPDSFPEEEHRGKKATLKADVLELKRKELPELTEDFAKEMGVDSLEALKTDLAKRLKEDKEKQVDQKLGHDLIHQLQHKTEIAIPEKFLQKNVDAAVENEKKELEKNGKTQEEIDKEIDVEKITKSVVHELKEIFLMNYIAEQQKIDVSRQEMNQHINTLMPQGGMNAQMRQLFQQQGIMDEIYVQLKNQKVLAFLCENATVETKSSEKSETKKEEEKKTKKASTAKPKEKGSKKTGAKKKK